MSIKNLSDELILIAYADKEHRYSMLQDFKSNVENTSDREISLEEKKLLLEVVDGIITELRESSREITKEPAKRAKKVAVTSKVEPTSLEVLEPEVVVPKSDIIEATPNVEQEVITDDLSFLDDLDNLI